MCVDGVDNPFGITRFAVIIGAYLYHLLARMIDCYFLRRCSILRNGKFYDSYETAAIATNSFYTNNKTCCVGN